MGHTIQVQLPNYTLPQKKHKFNLYIFTQNKNLVEVGQMGIKNESLLVTLSHFRVLRMGRAESQILVTHSHLTNFGRSGELHHNLHLVTLPIVIKKLVNWLTKKLLAIGRLSC